jgi:DNA-binding XRE family transcriptional regulator
MTKRRAVYGPESTGQYRACSPITYESKPKAARKEIAMFQNGKTVGQWLKEQRKRRGFTLEEVAARVDSHKGYVSGIENGKVRPPSLKFLKRFASLFANDPGDVQGLLKELALKAHVEKAPQIVRQDLMETVYGK